MGLEPAKGNRRSMWEKWATQDPVDKDALSTKALWLSTGTLGSQTTSTSQATTSPTSTSYLSRKCFEHRPLRDRDQRKLLDWEIQGFGGGRNEQKGMMQKVQQQQLCEKKYPIWAFFKKNSCYSHFQMLSISVYLSWCTLESLPVAIYHHLKKDRKQDCPKVLV